MLGVTEILAFLDTNMLVSQNSRVGGIAQRMAQRECFRVTVEYRLYTIYLAQQFQYLSLLETLSL